MAGLRKSTDYLGYSFLSGPPAYIADSGVLALTTTTWALTTTFASVLSTAPTVNYCKVFMIIYSISASTIITTVDTFMDDGTSTVFTGSYPASVLATAQRGLNLCYEVFNASESAMAVATGISVVRVTVTNSAGAGTASGRLIAYGWP